MLASYSEQWLLLYQSQASLRLVVLPSWVRFIESLNHWISPESWRYPSFLKSPQTYFTRSKSYNKSFLAPSHGIVRRHLHTPRSLHLKWADSGMEASDGQTCRIAQYQALGSPQHQPGMTHYRWYMDILFLRMSHAEHSTEHSTGIQITSSLFLMGPPPRCPLKPHWPS